MTAEALRIVQEWEYKMIMPAPDLNLQQVEAEFNRGGAEGWEFVSLLPLNYVSGASGSVVGNRVYLFKRPKLPPT